MKIVSLFLILLLTASAGAQDSLSFRRAEIIYGRKDGMALTMEILQPQKKTNGKAIMYILSGNYASSAAWMPGAEEASAVYLKRGYTVFLVVHGSQPRYTIEDELADLRRAVRFIRYNAKGYKIDPARIGITGGSSGGHLSLMTAFDDSPSDSTARDPINRVSARVQAVGVFYPLTDLLNYGVTGFDPTKDSQLLIKYELAAAFDFRRWTDSLQTFVPLNAEAKTKVVRKISPIYSVTSDDPPVLLIHGDTDDVVPLQQSEIFAAKLKEAGLPHQLIIKKGAGHGWKNESVEMEKIADWFDKYLK